MARFQRNSGPCVKNLSDDWADPKTIEELAVDAKKCSDLKSWLLESRNKPDILLLTGPTGCGKTTTVRLVARSLSFELREWITPLDRDYIHDAEPGLCQSQVERFEDFLFSASRYSNLFANSSAKTSLLLVEDYPNVFLRDPETFHNVLMRYKSLARSPIVFICSDVADNSLNLAKELFPLPLVKNLGIVHLSFNAVTRTRMIAAIKRMALLLQKLLPRYKAPPPDALTEICDSCNGDVRNAMLTLQTRQQEDACVLFDFAMKPQRSAREGSTAKGLTREDIAVASCGKDQRVGLLHAVGRVLYPKWCDGTEKPGAGKRKRKGGEKKTNITSADLGGDLVHSPNSIADSFLSTGNTFLLFVQENYLHTFSTIDSVAVAADCLSLADALMAGVGLDSTHEMSLNLGIRGVMLANKVPNRAWNPVRGPRFFSARNTHMDIIDMTQALFPYYPASHTVLLTEFMPYMALMPHLNLSTDQCRLVQCVGAMEPLDKFCETFRSFKSTTKRIDKLENNKASYVMDLSKKEAANIEDDTELHISEDESEEEVDEGAHNLTLLEAAITDVESRDVDIDYAALLEDDDEDMLMLP